MGKLPLELCAAETHAAAAASARVSSETVEALKNFQMTLTTAFDKAGEIQAAGLDKSAVMAAEPLRLEPTNETLIKAIAQTMASSQR